MDYVPVPTLSFLKNCYAGRLDEIKKDVISTKFSLE